MRNLRQGGTLLLLAILSMPSQQLRAATAPYEIDIKELEKQKAPAAPKPEKKKPAKSKKGRAGATRSGKEREGSASASGYVRYTVKPGDHIFKILMVRFGMSNEAAERLIPEIARINHISNVKNLKVGQVLLIPTKGKERAAKTEKGGKPQQQEPPEAAAMLDAASKLEPPRAPEPRAPEPVAPEPVAPAAPQAPPAPAASAEPTWICSVNEKDPGKVVDEVLNALSISWTRNKIIESREDAPNPYSIRVDRYFEHKGGRYIISIGATDPYSYTLIRLLESSGYRTLTVEPSEDFKTVTEKLLRLIGVAPDFGTHPLQGGKESKGFLIQQEDAAGRRVLLTGEKVDPRQKWVMKPGCLVK